MEPNTDFVRRILDYRERGASARARAETALAAEARDMAARIGDLAAFAAMDSAAFPVSAARERSAAEAGDPPDFGAAVAAVVREGGCAKLVMQARTQDEDRTAVLSLSMGQGEPLWQMEGSVRGPDGHEDVSSSEHRHADDALAAFTHSVMACVRASICGTEAGRPFRFRGDRDHDARTAGDALRSALAARKALDETKARRKEETMRTGSAVRAAWSAAASGLAPLAALGYAFGPGEGDGIDARPVMGGIAVRVRSGETWADVCAEASQQDPGRVAVRVSDCLGRREHRTELRASDTQAIARELHDAVLDEIEAAESAWVPAGEAEPSPESFPAP